MTLAFDSDGSWAVAVLPLAKRPETTGTTDLGRPFAVGLGTCSLLLLEAGMLLVGILGPVWHDHCCRAYRPATLGNGGPDNRRRPVVGPDVAPEPLSSKSTRPAPVREGLAPHAVNGVFFGSLVVVSPLQTSVTPPRRLVPSVAVTCGGWLADPRRMPCGSTWRRR